jgi:hypothetical protein
MDWAFTGPSWSLEEMGRWLHGLVNVLGLGQEVTHRHRASELHEIETLTAAAATNGFKGARRWRPVSLVQFPSQRSRL